MKKFFLSLGLLLTALLPLRGEEAARVFLEAESFRDLGGWVVDPESMETIGSSYIMAHGKGEPVADALAAVDLPRTGRWNVWVRTRDWTAVWKRGTSAGRFQIEVNGQLLPETLGTSGEHWNWQKAGTLELASGKTEIRLRDLTGFNGRCDAVYLTTDLDEIPENRPDELARLRERLTDSAPVDYAGPVDLVVVGGGVSGICAAVAASRSDCDVVLLQDRDIVGGCNSSEVRVGLGGMIHTPPYPNLGNVVEEIAPMHGSGATYPKEYYEDDRKRIILDRPGSRVKLMTGERVFALETDPKNPKRIAAVLARNTRSGKVTRFRAPLFVDATGDAVIARKLGCETMYGRESRATYHEPSAPVEADRQVMGHSVLWYSRKSERGAVPFPDIDWALPFTDETAYFIRGGDWEQEAGQYRDMADETEYIRDYGLLTIYSNWSFLKNHSKRKAEFADDALDWVSPVGGKRESYRVVGDYVYTQNDIEKQTPFPDATAATSWNIDLHFPDPINAARFDEPFRSCAYHRGFKSAWPVPYRSLYARDAENLFLAGRHISVSHAAFASVRVMRTLGMLGEVVGLAASICKKQKTTPRGVYEHHLDELKALMTAGVPKTPLYHTGVMDANSEAYHFKELGFIQISPPTRLDLSEELITRIKDLGMVHRNEHPQFGPNDQFGREIAVTKDSPLADGTPLFGAASITVGPDAVLRLTAQNALGINIPECRTLVKKIVVRGTLEGPSNRHVNLGDIELHGGTVTSAGDGDGSDIIGNFCFAGKLAATGKSAVRAKRVTFRFDAAALDGGSGRIDVPGADDTLTISSDLSVFHPREGCALIKTGDGTLILSGRNLDRLPIRVEGGTVRLEGVAAEGIDPSERILTPSRQ